MYRAAERVTWICGVSVTETAHSRDEHGTCFIHKKRQNYVYFLNAKDPAIGERRGGVHGGRED